MEISSLNTALKDFKGKSIFLIQNTKINNEEKINVTKFDWNKKIVKKFFIKFFVEIFLLKFFIKIFLLKFFIEIFY